MRSMTGFGRSHCLIGGQRIGIEVRSVNHRFFDVKLRWPWPLVDPTLEQLMGQALRRHVERGSLTVQIRFESSDATVPLVEVDVALGRAYGRALEELRVACGITEPVSLALISAQPGVLVPGGVQRDSEHLWSALGPGVEEALGHLVASRGQEGAALCRDLASHAAALRQIAADIARSAERAPRDLLARLQERLARLGAAVQLDPQRLAQEAALLADRADIAEELARLQSHLDEFERVLATDTAVGRRLEFLAQELHREVNTIGSKSQHIDISQRVIAAKVAVERIREQVQNVE